MLDFLGEVGVCLGGVWIALALAAVASRCTPGVGRGILLTLGVVFLLLQGGCVLYFSAMDRGLGGSGESGWLGSLTFLGVFAFLFIASKRQRAQPPTSEPRNDTGSTPGAGD